MSGSNARHLAEGFSQIQKINFEIDLDGLFFLLAHLESGNDACTCSFVLMLEHDNGGEEYVHQRLTTGGNLHKSAVSIRQNGESKSYIPTQQEAL